MATFMIVHGAWSGGHAWRWVRPLLRAAGHEVFTPALTGLGERVHLADRTTDLDTHIDDVLAVLHYEDLRDVVLVGHSYLGEVLFPHLDREVAEGMPVVSAALTEREWRDWDEAYNISGKSPLELGLEGHFLLDGLDAERRRVVEELVPPVLRFLLIHGFGWLYRRQARERWHAPSDRRRLPTRA